MHSFSVELTPNHWMCRYDDMLYGVQLILTGASLPLENALSVWLNEASETQQQATSSIRMPRISNPCGSDTESEILSYKPVRECSNTSRHGECFCSWRASTRLVLP